ncbi:MAG: hypothetical protein Homavirus16_7 [Homavirus sp.]|uniref:Proliferating cell nuclear antigen n=1 Tax=Homavirus sp. TaxID=2487769 RepID=A0A3G5A4Q6_9VIRU|nr:MAG: hypothetical protein Homavirus16_7 [Homavirus sp.]
MNIFVLEMTNVITFPRLITFLHDFGVQTINIIDMDDTYIKITGISNTNDAYIEFKLLKDKFTQVSINNIIPININVTKLHYMFSGNVLDTSNKLALIYIKNDQNQYILNVDIYHDHLKAHMSVYQNNVNIGQMDIPTITLDDADAKYLIYINEIKNICTNCKILGFKKIKITMLDYTIKFEGIDTHIQYEQFYDKAAIDYHVNSEHNVSGTYNLHHLLKLSELDLKGDRYMYMSNDSALIIVFESYIGEIRTMLYPYSTTIDGQIVNEIDNESEKECGSENSYNYDYDNIEIQI